MSFRGAVVGAALLAFGGSALGREFYVSVTGSDANSGSEAAPFRSLDRAKLAVREALQKKESAMVTVGAGDYFLTNALEWTQADSGSSKNPVVWRSVSGRAARLLGGITLKGLRRPSAAESERLQPEAKQQVLVAALPTAKGWEYGGLSSRGFARPTVVSHSELFVNGRPMILAHWPKGGEWARISGFPQDKGHSDSHGGQIGALEAGFNYEGDRPKLWREPELAWVHGYWAWDWANSYERISAVDAQARLIRTAPPYGNYGFRKGQRVSFLNILEELDEPGEWYLDRKAGLIYLWPPAETSGGKAMDVLLSVSAEPLLRFSGAAFITVEGFTLEATRASGVEMKGGSNNIVSNCLIRNIGNYGVKIHGGVSNGVAGCEIFDTGDGGVSLDGGDRQTLAPGSHYVQDCQFARQGRWSKCYVPAVLIGGVGQRASRNLIYEHPHCGILFTGNDHLIELNEIHHIALETGDVGAIYTGRDYTFRGNRIRYNYIHHTGGVGMGSMGVYMDDCVSGTEIFGNIFYKVHRAVFLGGGRDFIVRNNVFVECDPAIELDGRGLDASPVWRSMVDTTMRDRLTEVPLGLYREKYPALKALDAYYGAPGADPIRADRFKGVPPGNNVASHNVCVGKWAQLSWRASPEMLRLESNLTNAPMPTLTEEGGAKQFGPLLELGAKMEGFQRIPVEQIGVKR